MIAFKLMTAFLYIAFRIRYFSVLSDWMDCDIAEYALKIALDSGAEYAEARLESRSVAGVLLNNGVPSDAETAQALGLSVRFVVKGALGFTATNNFDRALLSGQVKKAVAMTSSAARVSQPTPFSKEKSIQGELIVKQKVKLADVSAEEKLAELTELDSVLNGLGFSVPFRLFSFSDELLQKYYVNSEGSRVYSEIPYVHFFYAFTVSKDGQALQRHWQYGATKGFECFKEWQLSKIIAREATALNANLEKAKPAPKGVFNLVVAPEVTGIAAHESGGHPYEADRIFGREAAQAGESFVKPEMVGSRIGSNAVFIADDPTIPGSYGFLAFDDEGVKARKKRTVEKGIIKEFMHNRETAVQMGAANNGCARANAYNVEPMVRMSNTFVEPGNFSEEELLEEAKSGIYIKNFMEWNIDDVRYQQRYVGSEAYFIEKGEIGAPVRNPVIELTTKDLWSAVDGVAKNLELHAASCGKGEPMQGIPVTTGGPSMFLKSVRFS